MRPFYLLVLLTADELDLHRLRVSEFPAEMDKRSFRRMMAHHPDESSIPQIPSQGLLETNYASSTSSTLTHTDSSTDEGTTPRTQPGFQRSYSEAGAASDWMATWTVDQLVEHLKITDDINEQAEILCKLKQLQGLDWDTGIDEENMATVRSLFKEVSLCV